MLDSNIRVSIKYYLQTFLEECENEIIKKKVENFINDDLDLNLFDESDNKFDNGSDNETDDELRLCFNNNKSLVMYIICTLSGFYLW